MGSEPFEETKIHAYESPGNPQHVGMMASKETSIFENHVEETEAQEFDKET